jgi:transposase
MKPATTAALRPERAGSARSPAAAPAIAAMLPAISRPASEVYKPGATTPRTISATVAVIVPTIRPSTSGSYSRYLPLIRIDRCGSPYYTSPMAMGKRKRDRQPTMWVTTTDLPTAASHPFYRRLNQLLREHGFDDFVEAQCAGFYAETMGRPGLPPGIYFRLLLIGYFEGIDSERGIAWRAADSLALRDFLGVGLDQAPPDHSTISRTRRLIALETHRAVFTWI